MSERLTENVKRSRAKTISKCIKDNVCNHQNSLTGVPANLK